MLIAAAAAGCTEQAPRPGRAAEPAAENGVDVELSLPPGSGEPYLYAAADGRVLMSWHEPAGAGENALRFAIRESGAWGEPRTVHTSDRFFVNWADFPAIAEAPNGEIAVHWLEKVAEATYAYHVRLSTSRDGGTTWSAPVVPHRDDSPTEHGFVSIVPWGNGFGLVWLDGRAMTDDGHGGAMTDGGDEGAMALRFTELGGASGFGEEILLDDRTCECCQTSMAVTRDGLIVAYRDRGPEEIRNIQIVRLTADGWSTPAAVHDDGWMIPGCPVNGPQLSASGHRVAIAWFTAARGVPQVLAAFSEDAGITWSAPFAVDEGRPVGRVDVELLDDGAIVTWLEADGESGRILGRRVGADGRTGASIEIASTGGGRSSGFPRMARAGDDLVIAWTETGEQSRVRAGSLPVGAFPGR